MPERWDHDDVGHGIGNAEQLVAGASELVAAFREPLWVAEDPDLHLLPHIEAWCEYDGRFTLTGVSVDASGAYILNLDWSGAGGGVAAARAALFALIGSFAEGATYVRQRRDLSDGDGSTKRLRFEVGTGDLAPDTRLEPHGHVVLVNLAGVPLSRERSIGALPG